ncbi:MAG: DNA-binding transcriptional MerR regulator [Arenicella sp.]|jgi:DNA-binding transcriptional MerR regulator
MKGLWIGMLVIAVLGLTAGAYFLGTSNSSLPHQEVSSEPKNLEEITELETEFNRQQSELSNRLVDVQNRIQTVKMNLDVGESDTQVQSTEIADRLQELNGRLLAAKTSDTSADVPFPPDSPAGKLKRQPRTESGIPVSVLRNYEKETGVSPDEVEALMRRTK